MGEAVRYFLGIGSNLGERLGYLRAAVRGLVARGVAVTRGSCVYETTPVDALGEQMNYLNAVLECESGHAPCELLGMLHEIERENGRERGARNAARTLDIDILLAGDARLASAELTVPHPRLHERLFVLTPLRELAPTAVHPVLERTIEALYHACRAARAECVRLCAPPHVLLSCQPEVTI